MNHKLFIAALFLLPFAAVLLLTILLSRVIAANYRANKELACPGCERRAVRPSWQKGWMDYIMVTLSCPPYRCIVCNYRFYRRKRNAEAPSTIQAEDGTQTS